MGLGRKSGFWTLPPSNLERFRDHSTCSAHDAHPTDDTLQLNPTNLRSCFFLYSFETGRWKELPLTGSGAVGSPVWSHDSRYLYLMKGNIVYRLLVPDGSAETVVDPSSIEMTNPTFPGVAWFGLTSDDRVVILRDLGSDELYALDLEYR